MTDDLRTSEHAWTGETEPIDDPRDRIRQGDVLQWEAQTPPWNRYAVVVTADCDIVQAKHAGVVSYVPLMALVDYWRLFTLPKKIDKYATEKFLPVARERLRALQRKYRADYPVDMSDPAIDDLVQSSTPTEIIANLNVPSAETTGMTRVLSAFKALLEARDNVELQQLVELLAQLRAVNATSGPNRKLIFDELSQSVRDLPGDAFFIGSVEPSNPDAHVAYLRFVRELQTDAIALQPKDLRRPNTKVRRIARLKSPFVYRLTQQLAHVFADIGLPSQYEQQRLRLANGLTNKFGADRGSEEN